METNTVLEYVNVETGQIKYKTLTVSEDEALNGINVTSDYVAGYLHAIDDSGAMAGWDINILDDVPPAEAIGEAVDAEVAAVDKGYEDAGMK
jgi:hypothetical protein